MLFLIIAAFVIIIDQITKNMALSYFVMPGLKEDIPIIKDVFHLRLGRNSGIAFSLMDDKDSRWIFMVLTTVIIIAILAFVVYTWNKKRNILLDISLAMILGGGIGNMIDRTFYGEKLFFGEVIDFLYFKLIDFPIFNIADSAVCVGEALLIIYILFIDGKKTKSGEFCFSEDAEKKKLTVSGESEKVDGQDE